MVQQHCSCRTRRRVTEGRSDRTAGPRSAGGGTARPSERLSLVSWESGAGSSLGATRWGFRIECCFVGCRPESRGHGQVSGPLDICRSSGEGVSVFSPSAHVLTHMCTRCSWDSGRT